MITAGVDVGFKYTKIVIIDNEQIIARCSGLSGGEKRTEAVSRIWDEALSTAGLTATDIKKVIATGQGKFDAVFAGDNVVEPVADVRAARFLNSGVKYVVDIGADQMRVISLDDEDGIDEVSFHQKCSAGLGMFLEYIARRLGITLDELSNIPPDAHKNSVINDGCPVFIDLDTLELLNRCVPVSEVAGAAVQALAVRMSAILNDKRKPAVDSTFLIGGVAKNTAVTRALKERSGIDFIIPEYAEYTGALGAALLASDCV